MWYSKVSIGGYDHDVLPEPDEPQFTDLNIIGGDFLHLNKGQAWYDYVEGRVTVHFGGGWEPRKKLEPLMTKLPKISELPKGVGGAQEVRTVIDGFGVGVGK